MKNIELLIAFSTVFHQYTSEIIGGVFTGVTIIAVMYLLKKRYDKPKKK